MQRRISLIVAFTVLATVSCLLGTVLTPNSSIGGEQSRTLEPVNYQAEEKQETKTPAESEEKPKQEDTKPAEIDTEIDTGDFSLLPIEKDMHEFMEYVFEPAFKRLKPAMAAAPEADNKAAWKTIKGESLSLAEAANLLLLRAPEDSEEKALWNLHSVKVRGHGRIVYQAARAKNFELASEHFQMMIISCNACHIKFADGEHILTP